MIDEKLFDYATGTQRRYLEAVNLHGSARKAAKELGLHHSTVINAVAAVKRKASIQGYSPEHDMTKTVPASFNVKGTSTLYDADGKAKLQWVKTQLDQSKAREAVEEWIRWLAEDAKGKAPVIAAPKYCNDDLLVVYPMGDPHFGMYAWKPEAGEDFDLEIAERLTYAAIDRLVASAPAAKTAIILELGDFFHSDNNSGRTERSGNALDVDTRWARVMQVGLRAMVCRYHVDIIGN